ncbi:MAG: DUF255 domain-containing protein [Candidatus Brocadiia bacterium]|jgi:uncharacterized protein YyaL (SSP411 family)
MNEPLPSPEQIRKIPPEGGAGFNRLIHETSPYLLQHARNPVDWHAWRPEAFEKARSEDKPIFLSVGYSTCHWCHVMERESFERQDVAEILNAGFVPIKVDREERPDLDEIYMTATQLFSGRGGWPNSLWLTPDGRPWYAGTYFPPDDRMGIPGFKSLLRQLAELWRTRRADVEKQADEFAVAMRRVSVAGAARGDVAAVDLVKAALDELNSAFDERFGGFGGAPKFPPHTALALIAHQYRRSPDAALLRMLTATLDAMARGGIHDHVGGGFHRYSTDERWFLPHFEKMLYDNAQLARAYAEGFALTGNADYRAAAMDTCDWVLREMSDPAGGFFSALDADSEGQEGKFYVWTRAEIAETLGADEGDAFCRVYGVEENGNFRDEAGGGATGTNILYLRTPPDAALRERLKSSLAKLLKRRAARVRPYCDDKALAGWNGLMIGSLAYAGQRLNEPRLIAAAERAAGFVLTAMRKDGRLLRSYRQGEAGLNACLDDYAFLADALLDLRDATGEARWLDEAKSLAAVMKEHFWDRAHGGFFLTSDDHEDLLLRLKPAHDQATPSGNGMAARVLIRLAGLTGEEEYLKTAHATLNAFLGVMQSLPQAASGLILAAAMLLETKPAAAAPAQPVTVTISPSTVTAAPGGVADIAVRIEIAKGYHINSHKPAAGNLVPTELTLEGNKAASLGKVGYPAGKKVRLSFSAQPLSVYEGAVTIRTQIAVGRNAAPGKAEIVLQVRVQPCSEDACLAPRTLSAPLALHVT